MSVYRDDFHTPAPGVTIIDYSPQSFHEKYIAEHIKAINIGRFLGVLLQIEDSTNNMSGNELINRHKLGDGDE